MYPNILVALSNITCIYPIYIAWMHRDRATAYVISFVAVASFISHLVENHKHNMPGIGFTKKVSFWLNRMDVLGCMITTLRFLQIFHLRYAFSVNAIRHNKLIFFSYCLPFILLAISENKPDKHNPKKRTLYIATHSIWHLTIFATMGHFLTKFIYSK